MLSATGSPTITIHIAYVTAGAGHRRAAEALAQAARRHLPNASVECVDVLQAGGGSFARLYSEIYVFLIRHCAWLWAFFFRLLDCRAVYALVQPLRRRWNLWITRRYCLRLRESQPVVLLATHFLPADLFSDGRTKGWLRGRAVVVVTDWHPHLFWKSPGVDAVVVSSEAALRKLAASGIPRDRLHHLGIPIGLPFASKPGREEARAALGLAADKLTLLITSGGTTVGRFEEVVRALLALEAKAPGGLQLLVVCGEDSALRDRLRLDAVKAPLQVFGFVDNMPQLMAAADVVVCKAGGLTISEALALGKPIVLYYVVPGQEEMNAAFVVSPGAAVLAKTPEAVSAMIDSFLRSPQRLKQLSRAAARLGRPDAADEIFRTLVLPFVEKG